MRRCPVCHKGTLRQEYGGAIECSECSTEFELVDGRLRRAPPPDPKPPLPVISPALRRQLFFGRLVAGKSCRQITDELRDEGIISVSETTVKNYRENHYLEIQQAQAGRAANLRIVTPAWSQGKE